MPNHNLNDKGPTTRPKTVGKTTSKKRLRRDISRAENLMNSTIKNVPPPKVVVAKRDRPRRITRKVRT